MPVFWQGGPLEGDASPGSYILVGTRVGGGGDRSKSVEVRVIRRVDRGCVLLDDVELDDRAGGVDGWNVEPVRPVDKVDGLGAVLQEVVVGR